MKYRIRHAAAAVAAFAALTLSAGPLHAQQKPPLRIGLIAPMSGPLTSYGKSQEIFARMAVEDVNAKGGINGSQLVLQIEDSQLDPGQAVLLLRKFSAEGYVGVIGPMTGTQWETASPVANQIGMPAIAANAAKPGITVRPWTLRLVPADDSAQPEGFASFMKLQPKAKSAVIVADVREATSKAAADEFEKLAKTAGLRITEVVEFSTRATDLSPAAIKVKGANPDLLLVAALGPSAMLLAKEFAAQGIKAPVLASSMLWPGPFVNIVGENGRNWYSWGFTTNERTHGNRELHLSVVKRAQERADPTLGVPFNVANWTATYDSVLLYADILRRTGLDGAADPKKARETIKNEFMKLKTFTGVNSYTIRDSGDAHVPVQALQLDPQRKVWKFPN